MLFLLLTGCQTHEQKLARANRCDELALATGMHDLRFRDGDWAQAETQTVTLRLLRQGVELERFEQPLSWPPDALSGATPASVTPYATARRRGPFSIDIPQAIRLRLQKGDSISVWFQPVDDGYLLEDLALLSRALPSMTRKNYRCVIGYRWVASNGYSEMHDRLVEIPAPRASTLPPAGLPASDQRPVIP